MQNIKAFIFDVFGTVVDWESTVISELKDTGGKHGLPADIDWASLAREWRDGYEENTRRIAEGGSGPSNVDIMHRELLDELLRSDKWAHIGAKWDESIRQDLNLVWHRLNGWPDASEGLNALKKWAIIATLSNGNVRLLVDMAKHAALPWDVVFSTELFDTFKPNPKAYQEAMQHLSLPPEHCAFVAAHLDDLQAAASHGMITVYVRRPTEDVGISQDVQAKKDGGEVDHIVDSFVELAGLVSHAQKR